MCMDMCWLFNPERNKIKNNPERNKIKMTWSAIDGVGIRSSRRWSNAGTVSRVKIADGNITYVIAHLSNSAPK